jgi:hypothetical protein
VWRLPPLNFTNSFTTSSGPGRLTHLVLTPDCQMKLGASGASKTAITTPLLMSPTSAFRERRLRINTPWASMLKAV